MELHRLDDRIEYGASTALLADLPDLFAESQQIWDQHQHDLHFRDFVAADYERVYQALVLLADQAVTFLEWGSGLGVVASMAAKLGYQSHGIEIDPWLHQHSQELAEKFSAHPKLVSGSFLPDDYQWTGEFDDENFRTVVDDYDAYGQLDMELRDFDLVYAYPWPGERDFFLDVMRKCGRPGSIFLNYDAREGILAERI